MNQTLWRLEQLQTRARIQASQGRYWFKNVLVFWFFCTAVAFMFGCYSDDRRRYALTWIEAAYTPFETVWNQGEYYNAAKMALWLNDSIYNGTPLDWLIWSVLVGLLPVCVGVGVGYWYVKKEAPDEQYIRGTELISKADLQQRLRKAGEPGLEIAGVRIPKELERSHALVCGSTGSGKSVTLRHILRQIAAAGDPCIVVDPDGEFTREFYDPARGDWLLNPLDARCPSWSPWGESENDADMDAIAASMFPITPEMNESATFYHRLARPAFRTILQEMTDHDPRKIPERIAKESKVRKEVGLTLQIATDSFRYLELGSRQWSAREWVQNPRGWCFFAFEETQKDAVLPIISLQMECLTRRLLASPLHPTRTFRIVIDELAALHAQPTLVRLINRARKRGVSIVLGFQDIMQLYPIYGKEMTNNMLNQPATRLLLRTNDGETQRWCSGAIGRQEVIRAVESETAGPESMRDGISRSHQRREEAAVMGSEFSGLKELNGYLKVSWYGAAKVEVPYLGMVERQPAFVGRGSEEQAPAKEQPKLRVVKRERQKL